MLDLSIVAQLGDSTKSAASALDLGRTHRRVGWIPVTFGKTMGKPLVLREWMACWGLGWFLLVSQWIIPIHSLRLAPVRKTWEMLLCNKTAFPFPWFEPRKTMIRHGKCQFPVLVAFFPRLSLNKKYIVAILESPATDCPLWRWLMGIPKTFISFSG